MPRFYHPGELSTGQRMTLSEHAARHVQVVRMQPGQHVTLFNGGGGEWRATIERMGKREVEVSLHGFTDISRELPDNITLALGMPANERMDWLVEKATELGVARIVPLMTERSVLRLEGERAVKRQQHWHALAIAACEQCGRNSVPVIDLPTPLSTWLGVATGPALCLILSIAPAAVPPLKLPGPKIVLSGPEGGLSPTECQLADLANYRPWHLGPRVLRAETAALAGLIACTG